jgi:hypothetical protein
MLERKIVGNHMGAVAECAEPPAGQGATHIMTPPRAFIRQRSGLHLNLLDPSPDDWTDEDLAIGLSRTFRWGGHSTWALPLSVAQHSLTVLALARQFAVSQLTRSESLRELMHDADESLIGGFDPVSPIKPFLGSGYTELATRLQQAVFKRYKLTPWTPAEHQRHKHADILAAASEAVHVAGWSANEVRDILNIELAPLLCDPLAELYDCRPWEPWAPNIAADRFLAELVEQGGANVYAISPIEPRASA